MKDFSTRDGQTKALSPKGANPGGGSQAREITERVSLHRVSPDLSAQIEICCSMTAVGGAGTVFYEVFPDSKANLIFRFSPVSCRLVLLGPVTEKAVVEMDRSSDYFFIRFRTGQVPGLADITPLELNQNHIELTRIRNTGIDSLADRLNSLPDPGARLKVMEEVIRGCRPLIKDERCRLAAGLMESRGGRPLIREIADRMGLHVRTLQRIFLDHLGMSPKRIARLIRFRGLLTSLQKGDFISLSDLAQAGGYTDQSHMIRDFKELTGRLPGDPDAGQARPITGPLASGVVHRYRP